MKICKIHFKNTEKDLSIFCVLGELKMEIRPFFK